jgi:predicted nucleotidyltransferase
MISNILSVILYGSQARNDSDYLSDTDICIFVEERPFKKETIDELKVLVPNIEIDRANITVYTNAVVDLMAKNGSLFLWHLKLEGVVLFGESYFHSKINKLRKFRNHADELSYHSEIYNDLLASWKKIRIINELDLSVLFTIIRNTCMVLSHFGGKPVFGRTSCFLIAKELFPELPFDIDDYKYLARWKIIYERDASLNCDLPKVKYYEKLIMDVEEIISYAKNAIS